MEKINKKLSVLFIEEIKAVKELLEWHSSAEYIESNESGFETEDDMLNAKENLDTYEWTLETILSKVSVSLSEILDESFEFDESLLKEDEDEWGPELIGAPCPI